MSDGSDGGTLDLRDVRAIPHRGALAAMAERQCRRETIKTREPAQDLTDAQRDAEAAAEREAWLTSRLRKEREFVLSVAGKALGEVVGQAHKDARLELSVTSSNLYAC